MQIDCPNKITVTGKYLCTPFTGDMETRVGPWVTYVGFIASVSLTGYSKLRIVDVFKYFLLHYSEYN